MRLPGEYRSFLREAGAGGAGPAYGLFPVRRTDGQWRWAGDGADLTALGTLAQPFPHVEAFNPADGLPDPPHEEDYDSVEAFNAAEDAYWEQRDEVVCRPEHSTGLLYLCHLGCAYREALVVTGPREARCGLMTRLPMVASGPLPMVAEPRLGSSSGTGSGWMTPKRS